MQTLTVKCKLVLSKEQREVLDTTMRAFAAACNDAIAVGRRLNTTSNIRIHRWVFYDLRIKIAYKCALAGVLYELLTLYACEYVYPLKIMATLAKQNSGS